MKPTNCNIHMDGGAKVKVKTGVPGGHGDYIVMEGDWCAIFADTRDLPTLESAVAQLRKIKESEDRVARARRMVEAGTVDTEHKLAASMGMAADEAITELTKEGAA